MDGFGSGDLGQWTSSSSSITQSPSVTPISSSQRRSRRTKFSSRNIEATPDEVEFIQRILSLRRGEIPDNLVCPVKGCRYKKGRIPDFRRHLKTHLRVGIQCNGMPWRDFVRCRHLFPNISEEQQPYTVPGLDGWWIGGCLNTFSRPDALKRHVKKNACCVAPTSHFRLHKI